MQLFLYEVVARIVAIYLCVDCWRKLRNGLAERKIAYYNTRLVKPLYSSGHSARQLLDNDGPPANGVSRMPRGRDTRVVAPKQLSAGQDCC
jgi:hypothetical protein